MPNSRRLPRRASGLLPRLRPLEQHLVDNAELLRGFGGHEVVALERELDRGEIPAGMLHIDLVEAPLERLDLAGVDQDVGGLTLEAARGLVDHDAGVREREAVPLLAGGEQERPHRGRLPDAKRRHRAADELHGVVDRQPRGHDPARRVDVERNLLLRVLGLEEEQLRDDERGRVVLDRPGEEDDALAQEPRIDVERALAAVRLLDHHRHEGVVVDLDRISHRPVGSWGPADRYAAGATPSWDDLFVGAGAASGVFASSSSSLKSFSFETGSSTTFTCAST